MTNQMLDHTPEQIAQEGERIYEQRLKATLEPAEIGRFVVIDVASGDYFLGDTIIDAANIARQKYPDHLFYTKRIGYPGIFKLGALRFQYGWAP